MNESIRDVLRHNLLKESEAPDDLRKLFPKRSFKGWASKKSKKDHIWYTKGDFVFRVEDDEGSLDIFLQWPVSLGASFIPPGRSWMAKKSGSKHYLSTYSDEDSWSEDLADLKKIMKLFISKS